MTCELDQPDIKGKRRPLWVALSDLCLDTEITDNTVCYIARTIHDQGFTLEEAEYIAFYEVFPPLYVNMLSVAGVWSGFNEVWLEEQIVRWRKSGWRRFLATILQGTYRRALHDDWQRVVRCFKSGAYTAPESPEA